MSELLTAEGYEQTKEKLRDLQRTWRRSETHGPGSGAFGERSASYNSMIREYLQDIKLYEVKQAKPSTVAQPNAVMACSISSPSRILGLRLSVGRESRPWPHQSRTLCHRFDGSLVCCLIFSAWAGLCGS